MEKKPPSLKKTISITALVTFVVMLLLSVVIMTIYFVSAPYTGYKFFRQMGFNRLALSCAENYAVGGNIDGLVYCLELDNELLAKTNKDKFAENIIEHTQKFYEFSDAKSYFAKLDEYYLTNSPALSRVSMYSYEEYLTSLNYYARTKLNQNDKMFICGKLVYLDELFVGDVTTMEEATIYCALYKSMQSGVPLAPLVLGGYPTMFYKTLIARVPLFVSRVEEEGGDELKTLFLLRSVNYLVKGVGDSIGTIPTEWSTLSYNGVPLAEAYSSLYNEYLRKNSD